jgi:hypothetical protein
VAAFDGLERGFGAAKAGEAAGSFALDEGFKGFVEEGRLFLNAGDGLGLGK